MELYFGKNGNSFKKYNLALDFHENTKHPITINEFDPKTPYKIYPNTKAIPLEMNCLNSDNYYDSFLTTLMMRKSRRTFLTKPIDVNTLSRLLTLSFGARGNDNNPMFRTYASAGARYPIEVYAIILKSNEIDLGIYHYNVFDNSLELLKRGNYSEKVYEFYSNQKQQVSMNFPCLILFSMVFKRSMDKYGEKGYRFALLDAGHMSQNLYLVSEYLKLGAVAFGGGAKNDNSLDEMLSLTGGEENAFYSFAVGHVSA